MFAYILHYGRPGSRGRRRRRRPAESICPARFSSLSGSFLKKFQPKQTSISEVTYKSRFCLCLSQGSHPSSKPESPYFPSFPRMFFHKFPAYLLCVKNDKKI